MYEPIQNVLPEDFDGIVRFTNWTDEDFIGKWGGKNYTFPKKSTVPMNNSFLNSTPIELMGIRKKLAKDLAVREFSKSSKYQQLASVERNKDSNTPQLNSIHQANTYSLDELAPYIQQCLTPLPISKAEVSESPKEILEDKLHKDDEGNLVTQAIDKKLDLKKRALEGKGL